MNREDGIGTTDHRVDLRWGANPFDVIVIGAGQASLALAWHLRQQGLRFVVLDAADTIGHAWRCRRDSLTLFTRRGTRRCPAWRSLATRTITRPRRRGRLSVPLCHQVRPADPAQHLAHRPVPHRDGVETTGQHLQARQVIVATGPFQTPVIPSEAAGFGGPVLVVGGENSGMQIAEELAASRPVEISVGTAAATSRPRSSGPPVSAPTIPGSGSRARP